MRPLIPTSHQFKHFTFILLSFMLCFYLFAKWQQANASIELLSPSALVMDLDSKEILYQKNINQALTIGSMTKLTAVLLVCEAIESDKLQLDPWIPISENATLTAASRANLKANSHYTVSDLLYCIFLPSGSDAVIVLGEYLYGSEENLVAQMNLRAQSLGLQNTHYMNCMGLEQQNHYSTASDLSTLINVLLDQHPWLKIRQRFQNWLNAQWWLQRCNNLFFTQS